MDVNTVNLIKEFDGIIGGIIGAVAGSVSILLITQLQKTFGRLHIYLNNWNAEFKTQGRTGEHIKAGPDDKLCQYEFSFELELYNSSDNFKIMRDVRICFERNGIKLFEDFPYISNIQELFMSQFAAEQLRVINVEPKKIVHFDLYGNIGENHLEQIKNVDAIYFLCLDEKNKKIRKLITRT